MQSVEASIAEISAIAAAGEVYMNPGDEVTGIPDFSTELQSHAPRLFVVRPDGSGFEWSVQQRMERQLQDTPARDTRTGQDVSFLTLASGKKISVHQTLTATESAGLRSGMQQFKAWRKGEQTKLRELPTHTTADASQGDESGDHPLQVRRKQHAYL